MKKCCQTITDDKAGQMVRYLEQLMPCGQRLSYHTGQILYYEGHLPLGLFYLQKGEVCLSSRRSHEARKINEPGSLLGFDHLVSGKPFCSTCKASTYSHFVFFPRSLILSKKNNFSLSDSRRHL